MTTTSRHTLRKEYQPQPALSQAGDLSDTPAGRRKYYEYLIGHTENEPARGTQRFAEMSKGWTIGTADFAKAMLQENQELVGQGRRMAAELKETKAALWQEELIALQRKRRRTANELARDEKSPSWKVAVAAAMKTRSTAIVVGWGSLKHARTKSAAR